MIKAIGNNILFKVDKEMEDSLDTKFGSLFLDTRFDPGRHAKIYGEVISAPEKLTTSINMWREEEGNPKPVSFYSAEMTSQMAGALKAGQRFTPETERIADRKIRGEYYDPSLHEPTYVTPANIVPEVKKDDRIYFHYNTVSPENRIQTLDGSKIYKVQYDNVFCAVRNNTIIPIGGYVMVEAVWDEETEEIDLQGHEKVRGKVSVSGIITELHDKPKVQQGIIAHIGTPLIGDPDLGLVKGNKVYFLKYSEFQNRIEGKLFYVMRQKDIIGKIE
jgi:co-chaperonin GroES (HSP10)